METPSAELFQQLGWMRFDERVIYRKAILMYKSLHNLAPTYLSTKFTYTSDIYQVNLSSLTDSKLYMYMPKPNLEIYKKHFPTLVPKFGIPFQSQSVTPQAFGHSNRDI